MSPRTPTDEPADLASRLIALVVDGLVVLLLVTPLTLATSAGADRPPGAVEVALLWFVYRAISDGLGGSLGKRLLRLRVIGPRGSRAGLGAGTTRNLWGLSSILAVLLPPLMGNTLAVAVSVTVAISIARHPQERGWHDRIAGTAVLR